jgi:DNA-directed RNA polymerase sigma subunit (sigma70/sigma32)
LAISKDLLERLTRFVLSEQQVEILKLRNGYVNSEPMTLDDIGKIYQLTRERIRQIESKALKRVYTFLDGVDLQNYWEVIDRVSTQYQENEANSPEALATQKRIAKQEKDAEREHKRRYDDGYLKQEKPDQAANAERSLKAATNKVSQVKWALEKMKFETVTTSMQVAAEARLKNPEASYSELAQYLGGAITKDMVASALRRLISLAVTHSGEQPPEID